MAPLTYKRRRKAFEGEDNRAQAIKRMQDEMSVRQKMERMRAVSDAQRSRQNAAPNQQQADGEARRERANREREITSHGGAIPAPRAGGAKPMHMTTRGPRRLSYGEAFSRRTTDTSRQRVMKLYGRSKPPTTPSTVDRAPRRIHQPVSVSPEQQAAQMRSKARQQEDRLRRGRRPRGGNIRTKIVKRVQY